MLLLDLTSLPKSLIKLKRMGLLAACWTIAGEGWTSVHVRDSRNLGTKPLLKLAYTGWEIFTQNFVKYTTISARPSRSSSFPIASLSDSQFRQVIHIWGCQSSDHASHLLSIGWRDYRNCLLQHEKISVCDRTTYFMWFDTHEDTVKKQLAKTIMDQPVKS